MYIVICASLKERRIFTQNVFHVHPKTLKLELIEFLVQYHCLSSYRKDLYRNDFVSKQLCIETSKRWNVKPSTFILYWIALTLRRKPYRTGIQMMIITEVNENESLKPTEKDINNQEWGLGFSAPDPLGQPLSQDFRCTWATCFSSFFRSQQQRRICWSSL